MKANKLRKQLLLCCYFLFLLFTTTFNATAQAPKFKVIAFYNGTWDAVHISFVKEANQWFPSIAAQYGFSYESTTNWNNLECKFSLKLPGSAFPG